jgi:hypothetical protein
MNEELQESAKAITAVAKTSESAIKATEKLGGFVSRIIKEPLDSSIGILTDKLKYMRWQRQIRFAEKCMAIIEERNVESEIRFLPPKFVLPVIENASYEDVDDLQDLWANLLTTALDPDRKMPRTAFIDILKQLEPIDALVLNSFYHLLLERRGQRYERYGRKSSYHDSLINYSISVRFLGHRLQVDSDELKTSVDNLIRLRLISSYIEEDTIETEVSGEADSRDITYNHGYNEVCITYLGLEFTKACLETDSQNQ